MEALTVNEQLTLLQEIQWVLKIKYKIDYKEIYKIITERFKDDIKYEAEVSFDGKRNYKIEKENIINFIQKL